MTLRKSTLKKIRESQLRCFEAAAIEEAERQMDASTVRTTAFHESSHAVVAELFDFHIREVSVRPRVPRSHLLRGEQAWRRNKAVPLLVSGGWCQHELNEEGVVLLSTPFRSLCYRIGQLSSVPAEERLGVRIEPIAIAGDVVSALGDIADPEFRWAVANMLYDLADNLVYRDNLWGAISELAETLVVKKSVLGDEIREIVHKHVSPEMFVSEAEQTAVSDKLMAVGGRAILEWGINRFGMSKWQQQVA